jgi:hypothetical protein
VLLIGGLIGHFVSENAFADRRSEALTHILDQDAKAIRTQVYTTTFEMFPRCGAKSEIPWFTGEYNSFDKSMAKLEDVVNHKTQTPKQDADLVRFTYIPYVEEFIRNLKGRDVVYKEDRLQLLEYRLASLKALDLYLRNNKDAKQYDEYSKNDVAVKKLLRDNPMLITAGSLPPDTKKQGNGMIKMNTYMGKGSGYTMEMINAQKFGNEGKIDELLGGGFIYAIGEYTQLQVTVPSDISKNYKDMYFVEVLDGYLKGVKGYVDPENIWMYEA